MKYFFQLTCCLIILTGCNSITNDGNNKLITFDLSNQLNRDKPLMLSEFVSSISYIPLETSKESLLDNVKFVITAEDFLIVGTENGKNGHVDQSPPFEVSQFGLVGKTKNQLQPEA